MGVSMYFAKPLPNSLIPIDHRLLGQYLNSILGNLCMLGALTPKVPGKIVRQ